MHSLRFARPCSSSLYCNARLPVPPAFRWCCLPLAGSRWLLSWPIAGVRHACKRVGVRSRPCACACVLVRMSVCVQFEPILQIRGLSANTWAVYRPAWPRPHLHSQGLIPVSSAGFFYLRWPCGRDRGSTVPPCRRYSSRFSRCAGRRRLSA